MNTGELLKLCREMKGLSLREVASKTIVSNAFISQIEKNNRSFGFDVAISLCDFYGITLDRLADTIRKT